eukprot:1155310-Pelagomonas_calceolata.AAC.1
MPLRDYRPILTSDMLFSYRGLPEDGEAMLGARRWRTGEKEPRNTNEHQNEYRSQTLKVTQGQPGCDPGARKAAKNLKGQKSSNQSINKNSQLPNGPRAPFLPPLKADLPLTLERRTRVWPVQLSTHQTSPSSDAPSVITCTYSQVIFTACCKQHPRGQDMPLPINAHSQTCLRSLSFAFLVAFMINLHARSCVW